HVEIAFGQAVNLVGPELDLALPPGQIQIRMMPLRLRDRSDLVHEGQRLGEILERIEPLQVPLFVQLPAALQLLQHSLCLGSFHGRNTTPARYAFVVRETHVILLKRGRNLSSTETEFIVKRLPPHSQPGPRCTSGAQALKR